jgi:hypothetical protein
MDYTQKQVVFLVRSFNDIDHFTPLIDRFCKTSEFGVEIFCLDWNFPLDNNANILYLKRRHGLNAKMLWPVDGGSIRTRLPIKLISRLNQVQFGVFRGSRIGMRLIRYSLALLYTVLPVSKIFAKSPKIVIFDYLNAGAFRNRKILRLARSQNVTTFCLPHGIVMYSNKYFTKKRRSEVDSRGYSFDYYFGFGFGRQYLLDRGIPEERIQEIGSLRYCKEWTKLYREEVLGAPTFETETRGSKLRVVLFLTSPTYNVDEMRLSRLIARVEEDKEIDFVIKPHTRGRSGKSVLENSNITLAIEAPSVSLIEWADAIISYGSSIAIQALLEDKALIYPNYIDTNSTHYDDMGACWRVTSDDQLIEALSSLKISKSWLPYSTAKKDEYLDAVIRCGDAENNVIESHFEKIKVLSEI